MNKVLCPTDFSVAADNAIEYAANFCQKIDAELTLLHVEQQESSPDGEQGKTYGNDQEREALIQTMKRACEEVEKTFAIQTDYDILYGKLEDAVMNKTGTKLYNLIIMGTHPDLFYQYFAGTNTYHVLQKVETPVLIVPSNYAYKNIQRIVYASNYQEEDYLSLKQLKEYADIYRAEIEVLHVSRKQSEVSQEVYDSFKDLVQTEFNQDRKIHFERIFAEDEAVAIHHYMLDQQADLLGIYMQRRNFLSRLFHDSVTKKLSAMAEYPILVFH